MHKKFLTAALVLGLSVPAYAAQFDNKGDEKYVAPSFEKMEYENDGVEEKKEAGLPIHFSGEHAKYDNVSGDFEISGNVIIKQGKEQLLTTHAYGNMKTGDVWLEEGGTIVEPGTKMSGQWVHYNFNTKTGEIKEISGKGQKDFYKAPHATILPDKILIDQGGVTTRCPAVKSEPCLLIKAKTFEVYPKERMVAHDVQVFVKGKHIYSRDKWENRLDGKSETRIMPRVGWDGHDNGFYAKLELEKPISDKTTVRADVIDYSRAGYKPMYELEHQERNFSVLLKSGWEEDDDHWYKKQSNWRINYKKHRIADNLPLSYSAYFEHGLWKREDRNYKSWHTEYGAYLNHDPIYLFNSENTVLNLTIGKKWVHESRTSDLRSTDMYYATLGQKINDKLKTWVGYYQESETSSLFDLGQPDMEKELRNGIQYKLDDKNTFTIINRFDVGKGKQYETNYRWLHRFCCWALEFEYQKEQYKNDDTFRVNYYFLNW